MRYIAVSAALLLSSTFSAEAQQLQTLNKSFANPSQNIILAKKKRQKKRGGTSRFCRAVFACRGGSFYSWRACMRRKGYSGARGSGFKCDANRSARG